MDEEKPSKLIEKMQKNFQNANSDPYSSNFITKDYFFEQKNLQETDDLYENPSKMTLLQKMIQNQIAKNMKVKPVDKYAVNVKFINQPTIKTKGIPTSPIKHQAVIQKQASVVDINSQNQNSAQIQQKYLELETSLKGRKIISKWDKPKGKQIRNFIKENALSTADFDEKVEKYIRDKYKGPFNMNIPKLYEELRMNRLEIINHFSKFLSMIWYTAMQNRELLGANPEQYLDGIDFDMFKNGVPQLLLENQNVVQRIIEIAMADSKNKQNKKLSLEDFLKCISTLTSTNFKEKVGLFFNVSFIC